MSVQQPLTKTNSIAVRTNPPARTSVMVLVGAYLPGYKAGGPIRSIANLMEALGAEFDFRIVTLDRDHQAKAAYPGVIRNQWVRVGQADVIYLRPGIRGFLSTYALLCSVVGDRK